MKTRGTSTERRAVFPQDNCGDIPELLESLEIKNTKHHQKKPTQKKWRDNH
jgi:hypothetical protein